MIRLLPILLTLATAHAASVRVSWLANPERDIRGYQVERVNPPLAPVVVETAATSLVVPDLPPGDHTFRVRAINTSGMLGEWGPSAVYQVPAATPTKTITYTLQLGNDLTGWFDAASVTIANPTARQFARVKIETKP